jgi:hypothetical protein
MRMGEEDRLLLYLADPECKAESWRSKGLVNWESLWHRARLQGVAPIVYLNLKRLGRGDLPVAVMDAMGEHFQRGCLRSLYMLHCLKEILMEFGREGVDATLLRGPALAETLYPDPEMRTYEDVDLLLDRAEVMVAKEILRGLGYRLFHPDEEDYDYAFRGELQFIRRNRISMLVELHWDTINSRSLRARTRLERKDFCKPRVMVRIEGENVPMLAPEDLLLSLCVHMAYNHQYDKLLGICDVLQLCRRHALGFDFDYLRRKIQELGINMAVYYGLFLSQALFDNPLAADMVKKMAPPRSIQRRCKLLLPGKFVVENRSLRAKIGRKLFREGLKRL